LIFNHFSNSSSIIFKKYIYLFYNKMKIFLLLSLTICGTILTNDLQDFNTIINNSTRSILVDKTIKLDGYSYHVESIQMYNSPSYTNTTASEDGLYIPYLAYFQITTESLPSNDYTATILFYNVINSFSFNGSNGYYFSESSRFVPRNSTTSDHIYNNLYSVLPSVISSYVIHNNYFRSDFDDSYFYYYQNHTRSNVKFIYIKYF
jgi:hypothetical protein